MTTFLNKHQVVYTKKQSNSTYTFIIPGTFTRTISQTKAASWKVTLPTHKGFVKGWNYDETPLGVKLLQQLNGGFVCVFFKWVFFLAECPGDFSLISHFGSLFLDYANFVHQEKMRREGYMLLSPWFFAARHKSIWYWRDVEEVMSIVSL